MIVIPNMDKPTQCYDCRLISSDGLYCRMTHNNVDWSKVNSDCPLIEIVRCKDCKWSYIDEKYECTMWCRVHFHEYRVNADGFCSYGERSDE